MTKKKTTEINEAAAKADEDKASAVQQIARQMGQEQLAMNQLLGRMQAVSSIAAILEAGNLTQLQQIKNSKTYRQLAGQTANINGEMIKLDTWEGFCTAIGSSRSVVDENLKNLVDLGEAALQRANELGMTVRELRKLRQLNTADQTVVIGEIEAAVGDKEAIVDLIDTMSAKHAKEREQLQQQIDDNAAEAKASSRIIADKTKKITDLETQIVKQENRTLDEQTQDMIFALDRAVVEMRVPIPGLDDAIAAVMESTDTTLHIHAANALREIITAVQDLQLKHGLGDVDAPDDSWMVEIPFVDGETAEDAPQG